MELPVFAMVLLGFGVARLEQPFSFLQPQQKL